MRTGTIIASAALLLAGCAPGNPANNGAEADVAIAEPESGFDNSEQAGWARIDAHNQAKYAYDLSICRALGVEAGRLRLDYHDDGYLERLPYVRAHQPEWEDRPVSEFRALLAEFLYQDARIHKNIIPRLATREAMQRLIDERIRKKEIIVEQADVRFRELGYMTITRVGLADWRHSPTRLNPVPETEWLYRNILSRGEPRWSEDASRFWPRPYSVIVVEGFAYMVGPPYFDTRMSELLEPAFNRTPGTRELGLELLCGFKTPRTFDACENRPANDPCL